MSEDASKDPEPPTSVWKHPKPISILALFLSGSLHLLLDTLRPNPTAANATLWNVVWLASALFSGFLSFTAILSSTILIMHDESQYAYRTCSIYATGIVAAMCVASAQGIVLHETARDPLFFAGTFDLILSASLLFASWLDGGVKGAVEDLASGCRVIRARLGDGELGKEVVYPLTIGLLLVSLIFWVPLSVTTMVS